MLVALTGEPQQALPEAEHGLRNLDHIKFYGPVSFFFSADGALCCGEESCHILLNEVSAVQSWWLPKIASFYTLPNGESLFGKDSAESGNHKKSAVENKWRKTFAGVKEIT